MMNPLNREMAYLRTTLLPGLMKAADFNIKNGSPSIRLFECANVHEQTSEGIEGIHEYRHLAGIILGEEEPASIHNDASEEDLFTLKGYISGLFSGKYRMRVELKREEHPGFDYAQTILINRQIVGAMGRLSSYWIQKMDLDIDNVCGFEINLEPILKMIGGKKQFKPIATFPKIQRDVNLVMNETQIVGPITDMMLKKGKNLIISANPINIFNDEVALGKGMKSVTFSIEFQHQSKTLEDKDVTPVINEIIRVAEEEFLAKLRT
jgi:phenylalanyl-tRNA synthetase beta chain